MSKVDFEEIEKLIGKQANGPLHVHTLRTKKMKVYEKALPKLMKLARASKKQSDRMDSKSEVMLAEFGESVEEVFGDGNY